jgi:hypothetical protein
MLNVPCWIHAVKGSSARRRDNLARSLAEHGVKVEALEPDSTTPLGVCTFEGKSPELREFLLSSSKNGEVRVIAVADPSGSLDEQAYWDLLQAGASDVLVNLDDDQVALEIKARFERWLCVDKLMEEHSISSKLIANSHLFRTIVRDIIDIGRFSNTDMLILGETDW